MVEQGPAPAKAVSAVKPPGDPSGLPCSIIFGFGVCASRNPSLSTPQPQDKDNQTKLNSHSDVGVAIFVSGSQEMRLFQLLHRERIIAVQ